MRPVTPSEVSKLKKELMPNWVLSVWNKLIAKNWDGYRSVVDQSEAINALRESPDNDNPGGSVVYYLEIEDIYRQAGWKVTYDKPGYNESYSAKFIFEKMIKEK